MISEQEGSGTQEQLLTAAALRQAIAEKDAAKVVETLNKQSEADRELQKSFQEFMEGQITQQDLDDIRQKILRASERGEFEVQVMRFPSKLCADSGRTINNGEPEWPKSLQGKAKSFYNLFVERGKPRGFKLRARILDFPAGIPGDVGLIVSWAET